LSLNQIFNGVTVNFKWEVVFVSAHAGIVRLCLYMFSQEIKFSNKIFSNNTSKIHFEICFCDPHQSGGEVKIEAARKRTNNQLVLYA
jgi:hypothetical protein